MTKIIAALLFLFLGSMAQAFPMCIFDKFKVTVKDIHAYHNANGVFFLNIFLKGSPISLIAIDQDCNLLYQSKSGLSIFEMDDISGVVYATSYYARYAESIDAYLVKTDPKTGRKIVKPVLLELVASTMVVMLPQFDIGDSLPLDIFVCNDFDKHRCDIYAYDHSEEKYQIKESLTCGKGKKPCNIDKMYAKMIRQTRPDLRH